MASQTETGFKYELDSITRNAPTNSGVFMIHSRNKCVYVGESDDISGTLLEIYFDANPCLAEQDLTHFSFELAAPDARAQRQAESIRAFGPTCNLGARVPDCKQCRLAQTGGSQGQVGVSRPV
jgi:hypothetical protein